MKSTRLLTVIVGFIIITAFTVSIPEKVTETFTAKFPKAGNIEWEQEDSDCGEGPMYVGEFILDSKEYEVGICADGKWYYTAIEIALSDFPNNLVTSLKGDFPNYEIVEVKSFENWLKNEGYLLVMKNSDKEMELLISTAGQILMQKYKDGDSEDEE